MKIILYSILIIGINFIGYSQDDLSTYEAAVMITKAQEGYRNVIYKCSAGKYTIGWGHRCSSAEVKKYSGKTISIDEAQELFNKDFNKAYNYCISKGLSRDSALALVSPIINLGLNTLDKLLKGNRDISKTLLKYKFAKVPHNINGKIVYMYQQLSGLRKRRFVESNCLTCKQNFIEEGLKAKKVVLKQYPKSQLNKFNKHLQTKQKSIEKTNIENSDKFSIIDELFKDSTKLIEPIKIKLISESSSKAGLGTFLLFSFFIGIIIYKAPKLK